MSCLPFSIYLESEDICELNLLYITHPGLVYLTYTQNILPFSFLATQTSKCQYLCSVLKTNNDISLLLFKENTRKVVVSQVHALNLLGAA